MQPCFVCFPIPEPANKSRGFVPRRTAAQMYRFHFQIWRIGQVPFDQSTHTKERP